nr:protein FAR1-RELATED SEQUENCE 5-like [Ipomoea batatas]
MADMEVILEQIFGETSQENAESPFMQDEENINDDTRVDEGVRYYKEYAAFLGFDVRSSTMKMNRYGDVEVKYLLCSREGYTVTKEQRNKGQQPQGRPTEQI